MSTRLEELCKMVSADSEDAIDDILDLLKPADMTREEMSVNFEQAVGYDPISYHDKKELTNSVNALRDTDILTPEEEDFLMEKSTVVVDEAYDRFNGSYRSAALNDALTETLADLAGIDYSATDEVVEDNDEIEFEESEDGFDD